MDLPENKSTNPKKWWTYKILESKEGIPTIIEMFCDTKSIVLDFNELPDGLLLYVLHARLSAFKTDEYNVEALAHLNKTIEWLIKRVQAKDTNGSRKPMT